MQQSMASTMSVIICSSILIKCACNIFIYIYIACLYNKGELLMGMGGDPEIRDNSGRSSFDYAEQNGHKMMLALLRDPIQARAELAADAELEIKMKNNADFLEACRLGSLDWATELLKGGANIEHRDQVCWWPTTGCMLL